MDYKLEVTEPAENNIDEIVDWISDDSADSAIDNFLLPFEMARCAFSTDLRTVAGVCGRPGQAKNLTYNLSIVGVLREIRSIGEKLAAIGSKGTATLNVPIATSQTRDGFNSRLSLTQLGIWGDVIL